MQTTIQSILRKLSDKSVMKRREALRELNDYLHHPEAYLLRIALHYVAEHDPAHTIRNLARQAFYKIGNPPSYEGSWEKTYL